MRDELQEAVEVVVNAAANNKDAVLPFELGSELQKLADAFVRYNQKSSGENRDALLFHAERACSTTIDNLAPMPIGLSGAITRLDKLLTAMKAVR